jgi:hypothetical protein
MPRSIRKAVYPFSRKWETRLYEILRGGRFVLLTPAGAGAAIGRRWTNLARFLAECGNAESAAVIRGLATVLGTC